MVSPLFGKGALQRKVACLWDGNDSVLFRIKLWTPRKLSFSIKRPGPRSQIFRLPAAPLQCYARFLIVLGRGPTCVLA